MVPAALVIRPRCPVAGEHRSGDRWRRHDRGGGGRSRDRSDAASTPGPQRARSRNPAGLGSPAGEGSREARRRCCAGCLERRTTEAGHRREQRPGEVARLPGKRRVRSCTAGGTRSTGWNHGPARQLKRTLGDPAGPDPVHEPAGPTVLATELVHSDGPDHGSHSITPLRDLPCLGSGAFWPRWAREATSLGGRADQPVGSDGALWD